MLNKLLIFFLIKIYLCDIPSYLELEKKIPLELNFETQDSQLYVSLNYTQDYESEDKEINNTFYYLLIDNKLNVVCKSNHEGEYPDSSEFNKDYSNSFCYILKYNDKYNIIRYEKVNKETNKNLFVFYLSESIQTGIYRIKKLSFPQKLEEKIESYLSKGEEIKLFYSIVNYEDNINNFLFYTPLKGRFSLFSEVKEEKIYNKHNNFNRNPFYKLSNKESEEYEYYDKQNILLIYENPNIIEETFKLGLKYDIENKYNVINLYNQEEGIKNEECDKTNIYIINSKDETIFKILALNEISYKYFNNEFNNFEDLDNIQKYEEMKDNYIYSPNHYSIFMIYCSEEGDQFDYSFKIIEEKSSEINIQNLNYFKISKTQSLTFPIKDKNNDIYIKLLSNEEGTININDNEYNFKPNENKILSFGTIENIIISTSEKDLTFAIKNVISNNLIHTINEFDGYEISTNEKEKFIIVKLNLDKLNTYFEYTSNFQVNNGENINYYSEFGYKKIKEISIENNYIKTVNTGDDINYKIYLPRLQLINDKKNDDEDTIYYILFYFSNLKSDTNITINSYVTQKMNLQKDKFIKLNKNIQENEIMELIYENDLIRFFVIPCNNLKLFSNTEMEYFSSFDKIDFNETQLDYGTIIGYTGEGYITYHPYQDKEYSYSYDNLCTNKIYFDIINDKIKYSFSSFSNSTEINYILLITENENYINSTCNTFENLYMNPLNSTDIELIKFSSKDVKTIQSINECTNNSYVELELPKNINIKDTSKTYIIRGMGITGPSIKDVMIYDKVTFKYNISPSEPGNQPENNKNTIFYIFGGIVIIIVILIIIFFYNRKKVNNIDIEELNNVTESKNL